MENENKYPTPDLETAYWYYKLEAFVTANNRPMAMTMDVENKWIPFLEYRSRTASEEYVNAIEAGASNEGALEIANAILFLNLNFTAQDLIEGVLDEHFTHYYREMVETESLQFWLECLEMACTPVFQKYADSMSEVDLDGKEIALMKKVAQYLAEHKEDIFLK